MNIRKNNKVIYTLSLTVILLTQIFTTCVVYAEANKDSPGNSSNIINYIDSEMNKLVGNKLAKGIMVSIIRNNEVVLSKGYGYADEKTGREVNPESTIFKIGSVSKIFVAFAAMQLKEQGKLDMKAPITQYLEADFPRFKYPVTMDNLLTHTAGFEDLFISSNQISNYELAEYTFGAAEMLYGKEQKKPAYIGINNRDISGYYIPSRSVFKGSDKFASSILNLLYGYPKHITGNPEDGFKIDGKKLIAAGEDAYSIEGSSEYIKFIQKGDHLYYPSKQYYTSCIRVPWYEGTQWQLFVILSFIVFGLVGFILAAVCVISGTIKKKEQYPVLTHLPYMAVFLIFISMVIRFIFYMGYMNKVFGDLKCLAGLE